MSDTEDLIGGQEAYERIQRLIRGEEIARRTSDAGAIPAYYGHGVTAADVAATWLRIWRNMADRLKPGDEAFYQSNAIGWTSR